MVAKFMFVVILQAMTKKPQAVDQIFPKWHCSHCQNMQKNIKTLVISTQTFLGLPHIDCIIEHLKWIAWFVVQRRIPYTSP